VTSVAVPALDTERTAMRAFAERDLDPYAAMVADPETMRFVGGVGSREEAWRARAYAIECPAG
jgi:RimJ/RimL family protein N-acetyltransferase